MKKSLAALLLLLPLTLFGQNRVQQFIDGQMKTDSLLINAVVGILAVDENGVEIASWNPDMPLLTAFIYLLTCATIRGFGAATVLNGFVFVMLLVAGEADPTLAIGFAILTALAEIIRYLCKYDTLKGVRWSFIPFAFSFFAYTAHWWSDTEGSLAAAVEEMRAGYDQLMIPVIDNILVLIVVLVLTIPVALLAMRLAERSLKKQTEGLK